MPVPSGTASRTRAQRLLPGEESLSSSELLVRGTAVALTDGYLAGAGMLRGARRPAGGSRAHWCHPRPQPTRARHLLAVNAAAALLDDAAFEAVTRWWTAFARRTGTLTSLPIALDLLSVFEVLAGRFQAAEGAIAEAEDILAVVGSRGHVGEPGVGELFLDAFQGDEEKTLDAAERRSQNAIQRGSGVDLDHSHYALVVLDLGAGRYASALEHCLEIDTHDVLPMSTLALPVLIEAAVRCDDRATANAAVDRFAQRATASASDWARTARLHVGSRRERGRRRDALPAPPSIGFSRCAAAFDCTKAQLLYGEWLRRARRRSRRPPAAPGGPRGLRRQRGRHVRGPRPAGAVRDGGAHPDAASTRLGRC